MIIESIPLQGLWKLLRTLPSFLLRWYFTPEKLAQLIYIDLRPRHDSAVVDLGQTATFSLWLQAINLSPFTVELDRASFRFWCGGSTVKASILNKKIIVPGEIVDLHLNEAIPEGVSNQMAKQIEGNRFALDGNIEFNCKIRSFAKNIGHLDGINANVINARQRANA